MANKKKIKEIFELIFDAITDEPQSVGKIAKKTGIHWHTVNEYVKMIASVQSKKSVRVTKDPTQIWYVEE